jgi:hypothetical protein
VTSFNSRFCDNQQSAARIENLTAAQRPGAIRPPLLRSNRLFRQTGSVLARLAIDLCFSGGRDATCTATWHGAAFGGGDAGR